jgi:hypothetical protein
MDSFALSSSNSFPRTRIPPAVARRIDRLARRAHAFHRFAHHPLCDRYASELVSLGRKTKLCRGCALVASGFLAGAVGAFALRSLPLPWLWAAPAFALALAAAPARSKLLRRFLPALALAFVLVHGPWVPSAVAFAAIVAGYAGYRRRGPNRAPCQSCPELPIKDSGEVCAGFRPLYRRERALQRFVRPWLSA